MAIFGDATAQANNDAEFGDSMLKMAVFIAFQRDLSYLIDFC